MGIKHSYHVFVFTTPNSIIRTIKKTQDNNTVGQNLGGRENATNPTVFFPLLSDNKAAAMVVYPSHYPHMIIGAAESFSLNDFGLSAGEVGICRRCPSNGIRGWSESPQTRDGTQSV